jgi:hypothetical protein
MATIRSSARALLMLAVLAGSVLLSALPIAVMAQGGPPDADVLARAREVHSRNVSALLDLPGVTSTGIGVSEKDPSQVVIRIYVAPDSWKAGNQALPTQVEGVPVEVSVAPPKRPE